MTYRHERRCRTGTALMAGGMALAASAFGHAQPGYEFDDRLLLGSSLGGGDLSRFNQDGRIDPGRYHVDVYLNERFASRSEVSFLANPASGAVEPCLEEDFLRQRLGAKPGEKPRKSDEGAHCAFLDTRLPGSRFSLDVARLRLDLSVPQALLDLKPRGYVSPEEWDAGDSMGFVNYDTNLYRSDYRGGESGRSDYAYVGLNSGINLGLWRLRHQSNYTYSRYNGQARRKWNSIRTYAQRALPAWRSELTAGESYTAGNLLGSIGYRGLSLATDDRMLPESLRRYAPQVRGTAATAARVVISQNGRKIREVNVAPGPFVIDDLYDSAYAGDLDVQVFEADGSVSSFSVPFASVPESMRPGLSRYSFTLGQARQYGDGDDLFADFTYQRGMSNALTANLGLRVADDYLAMLGGGVLATRFGAFGLNSTYSSARVEDGARKQGWRIGLDYSRTFQPTGTTLTLAGYRYSTEGYRELGDVLGSRDALRHGDTWDSGSYKQRNQFNLLVSQALGGYGNLYLSGSSSDFYDGKSRDTQLQFGYSNTWGQLSYNLAWSRQTTTYYQEQGDQDPGVELLRRDRRSGQRNDTLTLSVSMPLGSSSRAPTLSAMATRRSGDSRGGSLQTGLNGTLGDERTWSYALSANRDSEVADTTWNGTLQKQAALATVNAGYAQGDRYRQYSGGIRGALVAHRDGLTLGPSVGDTFALVEAKGASGAAIRGGQGARIDGNGYALAPSLSPYRYNPISLDPVGIDPDAELLETERKVAPYAGASVRVTFRTLTGHPLLIQARREDGSVLPLGAVVVDDGGAAIGMVGQGGQVYARAENQRGRLLVQWGTARKERCELPYDLAGVPRDQALIRLRGTCRAATTDSNLENAR
ncbi:fimbria/pilus outer membrane usher protein [Pseudomonas aeruginosa]|uniref:fimbria/pilus outer membrane usher protein n=1 Tax=Pseudomonas aeruginosa TaxID=287 RepID=UPI0010112791|nr:fimbria/pilus outer membrane usher protein [Pseudomonas aeruginosa]